MRVFIEHIFIFWKKIALDRLFGSFVLICFFCVEQAAGGDLSVSTLVPTGIESTRANFRGNVLDTTAEDPQVHIYYGTTDGESNPVAWSFVSEAGQRQRGEFDLLIGDLVPATTYYYRMRAFDTANPSGVWATSSQNFTTPSSVLSVVGFGQLRVHSGTSATIKGRMQAYGSGEIIIDANGTRVPGANVILYWGDNDGGVNPGNWDNTVALGNSYKHGIKVNGFHGRGFEFAQESYLEDIESMLDLDPDQTIVILGEPDDPLSNGMHFFGDSDFIDSGLIRDLDGNGIEDNFMTLFTSIFTAPRTGNYQFKMNFRDDRHVMWLDLDQNGIFDNWGTGHNGQGNFMNPATSNKPNLTSNFTTNHIIMYQGEEYPIAIAMLEYDWVSRLWPQVLIPGGSWKTINPTDPDQNGWFTINEQSSLESNLTGLSPGNTYYYRFRAMNSIGTDWSDSTLSFVAENILEINAGTLSFNTDGSVPTWSASNGRGGNGQIVTNSYLDANGSTVSYTVAQYDFDRVSIGSSVIVDLNGSNPLFLDVDGNATILAILDANGTDGSSTYIFRNQAGRLGGGNGGHGYNGFTVGHGGGPSHLHFGLLNSGGAPFKGWSDLSSTTLVGGQAPGGGSYGGVGGRPEPVGGQGEWNAIAPSGKTYGDHNLTHLLGGSGGGGGNDRQGGSGGGALKIVAGDTLTIGGNIWAGGGKGGSRMNEARRSGGSGSGGSIYLKGDKVVINAGASIGADGGDGATGITNLGNQYATDGGGDGAAAGGGGRIYIEVTTSFLNHASLTNINISADGGLSAGTRHGGNGTVKIVRPQVTELVFSSGGLFVDTDTASITHTDGSFLQGVLEDHNFTDSNGTIYPYRVAVFSADKINIGSSVIVTLQGSNALSLRTRNNGDLSIGTQLLANGGNAVELVTNSGIGGIGKLGGWNGANHDGHGNGPGGGQSKVDNNDGAGAGYGNHGPAPTWANPAYGKSYGDIHLNDLLGGSGGGGGDHLGGGAGGGAIELIAHGTGILNLSSGSKIAVNGGDTRPDNNRGGGGGSGGSIRLVGGSIINNGTLEAKGGGLHPGRPAGPRVGQADLGGAGGRIAFESNGSIKLGTYDLSGHKTQSRHSLSYYPSLDGTLGVRGDSGLSDLVYSSGTLTIDTTVGYWIHSSGGHGDGLIQSHDDNGITYNTCTFTFNSISLTGSLNLVLKGDSSLVLRTQSNGNIIIGIDLNLDGGDWTWDDTTARKGSVNPILNNYRNWIGLGKLGGKNSVKTGANVGLGAGGGNFRVEGTLENDGLRWKGGGGGYGSAGQYASTGYGQPYGLATLAHLHGGSSGGGGQWTGSGAGGGALSLEAHGDGNLTILSGVTISANGGITNQTDIDRQGGAGSGGSLRFIANKIENFGIITAKGGTGLKLASGGGGRVAFFFTEQGLNYGSIEVGSGAFTGTIHNNLNIPPTDLNATAPLSISENQPIGMIVGEFNATDSDANATLTYSLVDGNESTDNALFTLEANGTLKSTTTFNYESDPSTYSIKVQVKDEHNASINKTFTVNLEDINEAPSDLHSPAPLSIAENQPAGTVVGKLTATDPDDDTFNFSLPDQPDSSSAEEKLWIGFGGTTSLNVMKTSDWTQVNRSEQIKIYADLTWPLEGVFSKYCKTLVVNQPLDMAPSVGNQTHNLGGITPFSDAEKYGALDQTNSLHGQIIKKDGNGFYVILDLAYTSFTITDQATFSIALENFKGESDADELFAVGLVSSLSKPYKDNSDLFSSGSINMSNKECTDIESIPFIFIKVSNIPRPFKYKGKIFGCSGESGWQKEGSPWKGSHVVYTCISLPPPKLSEKPVIEEIYFTSDWEGQNKLKLETFIAPPAPFTIDANGTLRTIRGLDYETDPQTYSIKVQVKDEHNASFDKTFTVNLGDINEAPTNLFSTAPLSIAENQPAGTVVGKLTATDPDGDTFTYSLPDQPDSSSAEEKLWIGFSGTDINVDNHFSDWFELTVLDHEIISHLDVGMSVFSWNNQIVPQLGGTPVGIGDTFDKTKHVVRYNNAIYTPLGNISGYSDQEKMIEELDRMVTFSEISTIFGTSWEINGKKPLPYSKITIKDHAAMTASLSSFKGELQSIALISSPAKPALSRVGSKIFGSGRVDFSSVDCNSPLPSLVLEEETGQKHIYTGRIFKPDGSCSGSHQLSVKDSSNWKGASIIYNAIHVPVNNSQIKELYFDIDSVVNNTSEKLTLNEARRLAGQVVTEPAPPAPFTIDANGTLRTIRGLDYETDPQTYSIKVQVKDEHNASFDKTFTVNLGDINEAPTNLVSTAPLSIAENQPAGTVVGKLTATDPDGDTFTYSLPDQPDSSSAEEKLWIGFSGTDINVDNHFSDWFELTVLDHEVITPGEELREILWIGFAGTNPSGVKKYSNWYQLEVINNEFLDLTDAILSWNSITSSSAVDILTQLTSVGNSSGKSLEFDLTETKFLDASKHRGKFDSFMFDPIGKILDSTIASEQDSNKAWEILNGKPIIVVGGKLGIYIDSDYTKFEIASGDASTYAASLSSFCKENSVTELPYIVITANPTRPDNEAIEKPWISTAFDSDTYSMKRDGTWNFEDSASEQYNLKIDGRDGASAETTFRYSPSSPSGHASGPWNGIGMQFFSVRGLTPPSVGDSVGNIQMSNIKLELGTNNSGVYAKLSEGDAEYSISNLDVGMSVFSWNNQIVPQLGGTSVGIGDTFDKTKHVVRNNNAIFTPLGNISGYSDQEKMIEELDRMVTFSEVSTFFGTSWEINGKKPLPYSKITIKDHVAMTASLASFKGANLLNIALISSPAKPALSGVGSKIFGSGKVDFSSVDCNSPLPILVLEEETGHKHIYTGRIFKPDGSCSGSHQLSVKDSSNWKGASVVFNTLNANAPWQNVKIKEIYFDNDSLGNNITEKLTLDEARRHAGQAVMEPAPPSPFTIDPDGTLRTTRGLDYENDPQTYSIKVQVKDEQNASIEKTFEVKLMDKFLPITKTGDSYNVSSNSAEFMGSLTTEVGHDVSAYGFLLSESQSKIVEKAGSINLTSNNLNSSQVLSPFSVVAEDLIPATKYYFRAYATNSEGTSYGTIKSFTTAGSPALEWINAQATDGTDWWNSDWFGNFYQTSKGWVYHETLLWVFPYKASDGGLWLWKENYGWLWTKEGVWPYLWQHDPGEWLYLIKGNNQKSLIFKYNSLTWDHLTSQKDSTSTSAENSKLWIAFSENGNTSGKYSPFWELNITEHEKVFLNNQNYPKEGGFNGHALAYDVDTRLDMRNSTLAGVSTHNPWGAVSPFTNAIEQSYGGRQTFEGKIVKRDENGQFYVLFNLDYTRFSFADPDHETAILSWMRTSTPQITTNLVEIIITESVDRPDIDNLTAEQIANTFNSPKLSLKCGDIWTGDFQAGGSREPVEQRTKMVIVRNNNGYPQQFSYTPSWYGAPLINEGKWNGMGLFFSNNNALTTVNTPDIIEIYFEKVGTGRKIKFSEGNPAGSHCGIE